MPDDKEIRFTQKKVDESWKDQISKEKSVQPSPAPASASMSASNPKPASSKAFVNLMTSLGYQAMMHLGDIPSPETGQAEVTLPAAKEIIELLVALKQKTQGNLSSEESQVLEALIPELQMKFAQKA